MANPDTNRPLKVQVGIRDHWVKEDGPLQKAIKDLEALLGHDVVVEPEWNLLIAELDDFYEDKGNLVAVIADCVQVWIKSMMELLEDPANESWTDTVLEKVPVRLRVIVEVAPSDKASSSWSEQRSAFVVSLPKKQVYHAAALFPTFRGDLLACFDSNKKPQLPDKTAGAADDWAGVEVDGETGKPLVVDQTKSARPATRPKTEFLPSVASMPRPDLLLTRPPYHLTMHEGNRHIELQCSHSPSLQFLSDYLKRWCRINHHDTSNVNSPRLPLMIQSQPRAHADRNPSSRLQSRSYFTNRRLEWARCLIGWSLAPRRPDTQVSSRSQPPCWWPSLRARWDMTSCRLIAGGLFEEMLSSRPCDANICCF
jgi:hypothetical protein